MSGGVIICVIELTLLASVTACEELAVVTNINASPLNSNLMGPVHMPVKLILSSVAVWL